MSRIVVNAEVISNHVTDIEEPHCRSLLERVALRNLEEMVVTNQIDYDAIPLLKALTGQDLGPSSSSKQPFSKELILRVQTEVHDLSFMWVVSMFVQRVMIRGTFWKLVSASK